MARVRYWSWVAAAQILGCIPAVMAPTVVVTPGPGKAANDFAADHTVCAALADQQIAAAKNAVNNQIVGTALLNAVAGAGNSAGAGASKSAVAANAAASAVSAGLAGEQAAQVTLQRQFDIAYSQCMYAKGDSAGISVDRLGIRGHIAELWPD